MENKKNNKLYIIIGILIVLIVIALTYIIYDKVINKPQPKEEPQINNTNNSVNNENTSIDNIVIKNAEVKELYDKYFKVEDWPEGVDTLNRCEFGDYYLKLFKNHSLEDKIIVVLNRYGVKYKKEMDDTFYQRLPKDEREYLKESGGISRVYIEKSVVVKGIKLLFNIDLDKFDINKFDSEHTKYGWTYIKKAEAFAPFQGGGELWSTTYQQIIEYNELNDEINFTVVGAYMATPTEFMGTDDWEKTYVYDKDEKIYSKDSKSFKFTKDNIDKFKQLKYIFKKNNEGKYYLSDVINLNFEPKADACK